MEPKEYRCDSSKRVQSALSPDQAAELFSIFITDKWSRFTIWERRAKDKSQTHWKRVKRNKVWILVRIPNRNFDHLSFFELAYVCDLYEIPHPKAVSTYKNQLLDILDENASVIHNYERNKILIKHLGDFNCSLESTKKGLITTVSLEESAWQYTYNLSKKGLINHLLEENESKEELTSPKKEESDIIEKLTLSFSQAEIENEELRKEKEKLIEEIRLLKEELVLSKITVNDVPKTDTLEDFLKSMLSPTLDQKTETINLEIY